MKYDFKKLNEESRRIAEERDRFCDQHGLEIPGGVCATRADGTPANRVHKSATARAYAGAGSR